MTNKHPRDSVALSLSLSLGGENNNDRAIKKQHRRDGEFVCKTCSRAFATFQALGGHRTSHLRGRHGLALGLAAASPSPPANKAAAATTANKEEKKPAAAASHQCRCRFSSSSSSRSLLHDFWSMLHRSRKTCLD
ncbi:hypothetical protein PR202_ga13974 [Eleusine coracana subsp. coracana]|uniref:C2H2-type domain-containing protein n=1 Tax=Eleusine coracana subsp. coracana TaxID=191504 RepID=A0AAV5CFE8_ELECO|nr:hypothetical protein PR202_ga13974 [Eleusine coracana subsp. coracana]